MDIYLVRHGETRGNIARRHQADDTPLTKLGKAQAAAVAAELLELAPTHLITSKFVRAIETARFIEDACGLIPETSEAFVELGRPSYMYGRYRRSFSSFWYYTQWYFGVSDGDGESYQALRDRFRVAKDELAQYPADARLVVVSHAAFMRLFVAHLCDERALSPLRAGVAFLRMLVMPNTHVIHIKYQPECEGRSCAWEVVSS